jgi:hypothetical protein
MDRRTFQLGLAAAAVGPSVETAFAQAEQGPAVEGDLPPLPPDLAAFADAPAVTDYSESRVVGVARPLSAEVEMATKVLLAAPYGPNAGSPLKVAQYFLDVSKGRYGAELRPFTREWPVRANPVIHHFFVATKTFPEGDTTAWCAAFVNWCIARSLATQPEMIGSAPGYFVQQGIPFDAAILARTSRSAASGSFRCFPPKTNPAEGDVIVWQTPGTENMTRYCSGTGHVALLLNQESNGRYRVLGGNQRDGISNGAVTVASWPKDMRTHKFFGILDWRKA